MWFVMLPVLVGACRSAAMCDLSIPALAQFKSVAWVKFGLPLLTGNAFRQFEVVVRIVTFTDLPCV